MTETQFFPLAAAQLNLKRLLLIRLIVFFCQISALIVAWFLGYALAYPAISVVLLLILAVNAGVSMRLFRQTRVADLEFLCHLLFDVFGLSLLLYYSGGANNPFVSFYLVPITISAAILPWIYTWAVAGISLAAYTFLLFFYQPLSELMPAEMEMSGSGALPGLHISGMWFNFLVSAVLITYFVVKMASEIRSQDVILAQYREENMRNEQILAVAAQAAGTAHELGTPLNTMAILVDEMADDYSGNSALEKDLGTLLSQITLCKKSLKELVNKADLRNAGASRQIEISAFIDQIIEQWSLLRPEVELQVNINGKGNAPQIQIDSTLQQSVVNILNNAADASPAQVELEASWDEYFWYLKVRDFGPGINEELVSYLGTEIISDKEKGMGVGMILSQASIERLGGKVTISPHEDKGTVTRIQLPLPGSAE